MRCRSRESEMHHDSLRCCVSGRTQSLEPTKTYVVLGGSQCEYGDGK